MAKVPGTRYPVSDPLSVYLPASVADHLDREGQKAIPGLARDAERIRDIEAAIGRIPTLHDMLVGDSRRWDDVPDGSVHLAVTSPPYWTLKRYPQNADQLGAVSDYEDFLCQLDMVWRRVHRALVPGGRLVIVVGDVCVSRRVFGRHLVMPLHASIQEHCRLLGFDNLAPIIWYKIANARYEAGGGGFLGKPYEPNAIIKNDIEYILFQRKPGGYRSPTAAARILSTIPADKYQEWFQQVWTLPGASTREHPAPYPLQLAERLVRMFSFVGDTVADPFMGTGTTNLAAALWGRNSLGVEVQPEYVDLARRRFLAEAAARDSSATLR